MTLGIFSFSEAGAEETELFEMREALFKKLAEEDSFLAQQAVYILEKNGFDEWAEFYSGLERLDDSWSKALNIMLQKEQLPI